MPRFQRPIRALQALPAPVRWLAPPLALLACTGALLVSAVDWQPPTTAPVPDARAVAPCLALAKALPAALLDHPRADPPNSPYVAVWRSAPRTVLRCGVPRPASLSVLANRAATGPNVNGVQWYLEHDDHGGYRFTTTLRALYVEVAVPAGAYRYAADPLAAISTAVIATVPDLSGQLNADPNQDQG
ncbi:hypothetical protein GCM10009665_47630 [Kitasatospora nipponensis]|uniref:DUF3515 family protein n=1 Tax=Kitasatospora nipponensis TaxID=258049 RepID=A0ABP4H693_9ACTN